MSDDRAENPNEKPTVEIPAAPQWAVGLINDVKTGFRTVEARLDQQDTKLENLERTDNKLVTESIEANTRLTRIEVRVESVEKDVGDLEARVGKASMAVRGQSSAGEEQAAALAAEKVAREALAKEVADLKGTNALQLAILTRLDGVAKNPLVKTIAAMLATAFVTWLATHGIKVPQ